MKARESLSPRTLAFQKTQVVVENSSHAVLQKAVSAQKFDISYPCREPQA
jgi:hypothetical protein